MPDTIDNTKGENIQGFINIIQNLCNNVPINLDVHGIFSGITDGSTIEEKILCKMRLNRMILGMGNDIIPGKTIDKSYYSFDTTQSTLSRIIAYGTGEYEHTDKLYAKQFNFKITKFDNDASGSPPIYVVSVSSSFDENTTTLLPLPDYFIKNIDSSKTSANNYLVSPDHCVGFSRNGTYNVKFVITEDQYKLVFENKNKHFKGSTINFNNTKNLSSHTFNTNNPFPSVTWNVTYAAKVASSSSSS